MDGEKGGFGNLEAATRRVTAEELPEAHFRQAPKDAVLMQQA